MIYRLIAFLLINFAALGIGSLFTSEGVSSDWYANLNKAPWTPPGWVFGFAWTTIMICFAIFMAYAWTKVEHRKLLIILFIVQWFLNVLWNPLFFKFHEISAALFCISALTILVGYIQFRFFSELKYLSFLVLPYTLWLLIATSLNAYILLNN